MRLVALCLILMAQSVAFGAPSKGLLEDLRLLKVRESKRFFYLRKQLASASTDNVELLREKFREHKGRTDLLDRLIFYTDTHYKGEDEKSFLRTACLKLAEREVQNPEMLGNGFWAFYRNASEVLADAKDSDLTAVALLETYMTFASVTQPKSPKGFLGSRDYTNGETYETAKSMSKESVGDLVTVTETPVVSQAATPANKLAKPQLKPVFISEQKVFSEAREIKKSQEKN